MKRRALRIRRIKLAAAIAVGCAAAFPLLNRLTCHPGETVILLMPPALGALLWWGWPSVRRTARWRYGMYLLAMTAIIAAAESFAAYVARGRVLRLEVFWAVYFVVAWRLAWAVWKATFGRLGERYRRWGRMVRAGGTGPAVTRIPSRTSSGGNPFQREGIPAEGGAEKGFSAQRGGFPHRRAHDCQTKNGTGSPIWRLPGILCRLWFLKLASVTRPAFVNARTHPNRPTAIEEDDVPQAL